MSQIYIPLFSALFGAVIGAVASIVTVWIQSKTADRRDRLRHAADLALQDYRIQLELAEKSGKRFSAPPVALFLHYHLGLMDLMEKQKLDTSAIKKLAHENAQFMEAIRELNDAKKFKD